MKIGEIKQMRNTVLELILIASVASIWISGGLAYPQYLDAYNTTFNTNASCSICHINPDGGPRTAYGMMFENQTKHASNPSATLQAIGPAPGTIIGVPTTATPMVTATSTATLIAKPLPSNATSTPIPTSVLITTPVAIETTSIVKPPIPPTPTPTPAAPGFGLSVLIAGLLACYFILKQRNN